MAGIKYDEGKVRLDLIDPKMILALGEVLTFGAKRHGENTWQEIEIYRYEAALMRHLMAYKQGEEIDPDSKLPHLYHVLCNAAFMVAIEKSNPLSLVNVDTFKEIFKPQDEPQAESEDVFKENMLKKE